MWCGLLKELFSVFSETNVNLSLFFFPHYVKTNFSELFSSAACEHAETFRAPEPEADVCVRPVLEERPGQRGRQEQEVLLSQSKTPVSPSGPGNPEPLRSVSPHVSPSPSWLRWTKDKRVVLVSSHERKKWTTVRSIPTKKPIPVQFEVFLISHLQPRYIFNQRPLMSPADC